MSKQPTQESVRVNQLDTGNKKNSLFQRATYSALKSTLAGEK
jgi:hypothetical protein